MLTTSQLPVASISASVASPDPTCGAESSSKSAGSFTPTSFTITNNTDVPLTLFWIDFKGVRENWGNIAVGATNHQGDYTGHVWVAAIASSGICVHLFTSTLTPLQVSVGQVSSTPTPASGDPRLEGIWNLQSTVTSVTPPQSLPAGATLPAGALPVVGASGTAQVNIIPVCARPAACDVNVLEVTPGSAKGGNSGGGLVAVGAGPSNLLTHSGSAYTYIPNGFGSGPCVGSFTNYVSSGLTLSVTASAAAPDGTLLATRLTGAQRVVGFSCVQGSPATFFYDLTINQGVAQATTSASPTPRSAPPGAAVPSKPSFSAANQPPISSALASPLQVFSSPVHTIINVAIAAALVLFITFPSQLFNHTLEENYAEIRRRLVHFLRLPARLATPAPATVARVPTARVSALIFWLVVIAGALLGALLNPHFGFNLPTGLALVATAITILWGLGVAYAVSSAFRSARHTPSPTYFKALPAGLIIAGLCVLASRLSDFQPGYLYGLVYSVAFVSKLPRNQDGQLTALSSLSGLGLAVLAWLAWTPLHTLNAGGIAGFALLIATSVLASLFVGGLVGSVLSLAPLRFLSGHKLFSWRREVWAILFGFALFLLLQILLLPAKGGHAGSAPIVTAIIFLVVFGAFSVAFWWYFARRKAPDLESESASITVPAPQSAPEVEKPQLPKTS